MKKNFFILGFTLALFIGLCSFKSIKSTTHTLVAKSEVINESQINIPKLFMAKDNAAKFPTCNGFTRIFTFFYAYLQQEPISGQPTITLASRIKGLDTIVN